MIYGVSEFVRERLLLDANFALMHLKRPLILVINLICMHVNNKFYIHILIKKYYFKIEASVSEEFVRWLKLRAFKLGVRGNGIFIGMVFGLLMGMEMGMEITSWEWEWHISKKKSSFA